MQSCSLSTCSITSQSAGAENKQCLDILSQQLFDRGWGNKSKLESNAALYTFKNIAHKQLFLIIKVTYKVQYYFDFID